MPNINPENLRPKVISVEKRVTIDNFETGEDPDKSKVIHPDYWCRWPAIGVSFPSIVDAFRKVIGDPDIKAEEIRTFDPNIYRDAPDGGAIVVRDNTADGKFRCMYDRMESVLLGRRRIPARIPAPTDEEMEKFKRGEINLNAANYEIHFTLQVVGLGEDDLAELLGVSRPG